ncbi:MAG: hypothetical protein KIT56_03695 [Gammaproteobacteria bacterium]|nr:hypothetical protein [Gammaproteobacteria bacterium]MCW5582979.1 hypothetical protein [Gammaproteobacteria bacterium]
MISLIRKISHFFKTRLNSFQKIFTILGCITGFGLSIAFIASGIAAIPFTGGGSLLLGGIAAALFIVLVTGSFGSAGKYIGLSIDTIISKEKVTNEKIATVAGCLIGLIISLLAVPLNYVGVGFIAEKAAVASWEILLPFIPLTIGAFGSACSYIGRSIDALTGGKTIFDLFSNKNIPSKQNEEKKPLHEPENIVTNNNILNSQDMNKNFSMKKSLSLPCFSPGDLKRKDNSRPLKRSCSVGQIGIKTHHSNKQSLNKSVNITNARSGIEAYLRLSREQNSHLGFFSKCFDSERGKIRAEIYLKLLSSLETDSQKTVIIYSLLASDDGTMLKEQVSKNMGYKDSDTAKTEFAVLIKKQVPLNRLRLLNNEVISPLVKYTNNMKTLDSGYYDDALECLKMLSS